MSFFLGGTCCLSGSSRQTVLVPRCTFKQIPNGDFKQGLAGWRIETEPVSDGSFSLFHSNTPNPVGLQPSKDPTPPLPYPMTIQDGPGSYALHIPITIPLQGKTTLHFDFDVNSGAPPINAKTMSCSLEPNQQARVSILPLGFTDWFGPTSTELKGHVFIPSPEFREDQAPSFSPFSWDLSEFKGQSVILAFREVDNAGFYNLAINNVCLQNTCCDSIIVRPLTPVPAPSPAPIPAARTRSTQKYSLLK